VSTFENILNSALGVNRDKANQSSIDLEAQKIELNKKILENQLLEQKSKNRLIITVVSVFVLLVVCAGLFLYFKDRR
jgi:hypothetical protein